jgi:predicted nucleic acid-binding Zn ribbon protein
LQQQQSKKKGIIIFGAIVLIFLVLCLFAYIITGDKGIEERFSNAVGLPSESEGGNNGILGFTLEGNQLSYVIILSLILVTVVLIYMKY